MKTLVKNGHWPIGLQFGRVSKNARAIALLGWLVCVAVVVNAAIIVAAGN